MPIFLYLKNINQRYQLGNATEHTYRGDLQTLIETLVPDILATNEPQRQNCGAPDYILTKKEIPLGFIEAKNIGDLDLEGKTHNKEQFSRYKKSLNNLIFTDYLRFYFYQKEDLVSSIAIGKIVGNKIQPLKENFNQFTTLIKNFSSYTGQTITNSQELAIMMAGKARLLANIIEKALISDEESMQNSALKDQMQVFKRFLIHDINPSDFADAYAQTIVYGMFAARLHDPTLDTFSRQEAYELIPRSNPFLKSLFGHIAGLEVDSRIQWIVDDLVNIFLACNIKDMLKNYGKSTFTNDPIIHFYEDFLKQYDADVRKDRGVWYTPQPVVEFIVKAVDDVLKTQFNLQGLADTTKTTITIEKQKQEVHKVQILDPATGTGTFLAQVIKHIYKKFQGQQGVWNSYVENHLIPRLNGFELLMASYAMAHLQLDLLLTETGYTPQNPQNPQRLRVFLTNSLEEHHPDTGTIFASWLSKEAEEANHIKKDAPVMCVIGNPPYSGESANKGKWIMNLMEDYKKEPGGKEKLKERNPKWINDDYVKFLRYGQFFIEKNKSGVLAYINPHGFLDNPTFRGMRWNLLKTYDKIYTIDLHGNSKKKETAPDGSADHNVFNIMQGVSINIFVKTGQKKANQLGKVYHFDLYGTRDFKYNFLSKNLLKDIPFQEITNVAPHYFFVPKDYERKKEYDKGFLLTELFKVNNVGIITARDSFTIHDTKEEVENTIKEFLSLEDENARTRFNLGKDVRDWQVNFAKKDLKESYPNKGIFTKISYRPFDTRWTFYTGKSKGFHCYPRTEVMQHFMQDKNVGLVLEKIMTNKDLPYRDCFISKSIYDGHLIGSASYAFPLYLYPEEDSLNLENQGHRTPNFNMEIVEKIAQKLNLKFVEETSPPPPKEGLSFSSAPTPPKEGLNSSSATRLGEAGYITANPKNYVLIKEMRDSLKNNPTEAEKVMWEYYQNKKTGHKIRRQHIIDDFITDFVCLSKKLVIEIDGKIHLQQKEYDKLRTQRLNELGYEVIRFTNEEVLANPQLVASKTKKILDEKSEVQNEDETPSPPLEGLGEVKHLQRLGEVIKSEKIITNSPPLEGLGEVKHLQGFGEVSPINILDYIYAVLHSPSYREKYQEFLKIDFPRVPYPKDTNTFWQLVSLGGQLREIHLLESPVIDNLITQFPNTGNNCIDKVEFVKTSKNNEEEKGRVDINKEQYFDNVPLIAWEFYIGGYQPAQKWLKDRKNRALEYEDIIHYQKIIVALYQTHHLMQEINKIEF